MARRGVEVAEFLPMPPEAAWAVAGDFLNPWHPLFDGFSARESGGVVTRRFSAKGEAGEYLEQQTYRSGSDRVLGYRCLSGIAGASAYEAELSVLPEGAGCRVVWRAEIEGEEPRLSAIAEGTEAVFRMGLAALPQAQARAAAPLPAGRAELRPCAFGHAPRLTGLRAGAEQGRVVALFLHGIGGAAGNWAEQLAALGPLMPAVALNLRGYGGSDRGAAQTTVGDYVADILTVMEETGAEKLLLIGLSYGAWVATSFALAHPEELAGLVLSGGCTGMSEAGEAEREAFRTARELPLDAGQTPRDFAPNVVKVLAGPDATEAQRQALFDSMAAIPADSYRDALVCFTNPPGRFDFSRIAMPVLMMTGSHDRLAPPAEIRSVARRIAALAPVPSVRFEEIARAGHVCNLEQPEAYSAHLLAFARSLA